MNNVIPFPVQTSAVANAATELLLALTDLRNGLTLLSLISAHADLRGERLPTDERIEALLDGIAAWLASSAATQWRSDTSPDNG
jgi:hypothetical protein